MLTRIKILISVLLMVKFAWAQPGNQQPKISVNYNNVPLEEVLNDLEQKTPLRFSYNPKQIPLELKITYKTQDTPLNEVVDEVFNLAGISYEPVGDYMVLQKRKEEPKKPEQNKTVTKYTISGYLTDNRNQEALIGAAVYNPKSGHGTTTNNYGYFSLTLPEGEYQLQTSYLGYQPQQKSVVLNKNMTWNPGIAPTASMVEEIVVSSVDKEEEIQTQLAAQTDIKPFEVKRQTAALGETDMLKSLDNIPGISFQADGSSYFYVRGGNRDQNLILLDEAPIYNPSHMLGLFTPIIPDAVKNTSIYKADFPVLYGGRLSSLIDIRTRDGNMEQFGGNFTLGVASARLSVEGPFKEDRSSYFISFRRSYFGGLVKAVNPNVKDFYFNDFTSKLNFRLGEKNRLFLTLYNGKDKFITQESATTTSGLEWGNTSFTARWNHLFGPRLFMNTTMYTSKYNYFLHTNYTLGEHWNSHISSGQIKSDFTFLPSPQLKIHYGLKAGNYYFNPGNHNGENVGLINTVSPVNSTELIAYAGAEHEITYWLQANYGLRWVNWSNYGEAFVVNYSDYQFEGYTEYADNEKYYSNNQVEPRVSLSFRFNEFSSLKASYNRTLQHINLINNSISPFNSLEVWLPSGPNIKPQKADIYNLGFLKSWPEFTIDFTADVYYKKLHNQMGYRYHANTLLNPLLEGELRQGNGKAYGFEIGLNKSTGKVTGQLGYSFTRSLLQIGGLNGGREFKARQDKPVDFTLSIYYQARQRWQLSINAIYSSGNRYTTPTSFYWYNGYQVPVYTEQNNQRLPNYKRVDVGSQFRLNKNQGRFQHHLTLSVFNFFNAKNTAFIYFTKTVANEGDLLIPADKENPQPQVPTHRYIYTFMPSITYQLQF